MENTNQAENTNQEVKYNEYEGSKFKVEMEINGHDLELFDSYTERSVDDTVGDIPISEENLPEFAQNMLMYAKTYKNWRVNPRTNLRSYNKSDVITSKKEMAITAKCYFYDTAHRMLRSLNKYGAEISKYVKPGTPHYEMCSNINLATSILESFIEDYTEDKVQAFLYEMVSIAEDVYSHCKATKDAFIANAMSQLKKENRTEEAVSAQA